MKPISVKFRCFGPYMEQQFIDFAKLEQNGLFLICGETGAGKTTILDAICIALYGKSSGGSRGELSEMRCKLAGKDDITEVEFVFENGGRQYKFSRSLRVARKNETEAHQCSELLSGQWVPILENPKKTNVNAQAEEIIGLTYDQFRQVIILPQGQFEKLLTSDSQEKEKILATLFHTERWERVVEELCRRVKERDDALKSEWDEMERALRKYECDSLEALAEKAAQDTKALEEIKAQAKVAKGEEGKAKKIHQQALLENQEFEELARRKQKLEGLSAQKENFAKDEVNLRLADSAEQLRGVYTAYETAQATVTKAEVAYKEAIDNQTEKDIALKEAQTAREAYEKGRAEHEKTKAFAIQLEGKRSDYQAISEKQATLESCQKQQKAATEGQEKAEKNFKTADEEWQAALEAQQKAREAHQSAQESYLQGIGGILAQRLQPGAPCPVCGSSEHPCPAKAAEGQVTDQQLNDLSEAVNDSNNREIETREARAEAEQAKNEAMKALGQADKALAEAQAAYDQVMGGMIPEIETEAELDAQLAALGKTIENFEKMETSTQETLTAAKSDSDHARKEVERLTGELEQAQKSLAASQAAWEEALKGSPLENESQFLAACIEPEEREEKRQACIQFQADLTHAKESVEEKRQALKDKTPPDIEALGEAVEKAEQVHDGLKAQTVRLEESQKALERDHKDLIHRKKTHDTERMVVDSNKEFADKLRGRAGVSLQRYVLGVKLSAITVAANRLLETVYGGRYRLYRTDEVAGRAQKAGLELEVYDAVQNQRRSVTSLSGGEKFLVALSLAIGLSTVVQASGGGVHMEAMFVDEGFGSLDNNAVDDAMGILQGIQRNAGMVVGIISHVARLEETIPTKLEAKKGSAGSTIHIHY